MDMYLIFFYIFLGSYDVLVVNFLRRDLYSKFVVGKKIIDIFSELVKLLFSYIRLNSMFL